MNVMVVRVQDRLSVIVFGSESNVIAIKYSSVNIYSTFLTKRRTEIGGRYLIVATAFTRLTSGTSIYFL